MSTKLLSIIPPVYLFLALCFMILLHFCVPTVRLFGLPWSFLGAVPLIFGIGLNLAADKALKNHNTTVKPLEESTALAKGGVFRLTRHPMYLGFVMILAGMAILMGSLTPWFVVVAFGLFIERVFIRHEETKMKKAFGAEWQNYVSEVRRWI